MTEEKIELGIDPKPVNETESRQIELILNFLKYNRGLSFKKIRLIMPHFYGNENQVSDEKKLQRDVEELKELGFSIKYYKSHLENSSNLGNVYKLESDSLNSEILFSADELRVLSEVILDRAESGNSEYLFSIAQKIFSRNLNYFPRTIKPKYGEESDRIETSESAREEIFIKLIQAIKDKTPLKIWYKKHSGAENEIREIEPVELVKKGVTDYYIIAYDREKREFRKFILPKVEKIAEVSGIFIHSRKPTKEERNFHPLGYKVHDPLNLDLVIGMDDSWKLKDFLSDYPYTEEKNRISLSTTNLDALCDFLYSSPEISVQTDSKKLVSSLEQYVSEIKENYMSSEMIS